MTCECARLSSFRRVTYISSGDKSAKIPEIYARPGSTATIIPACNGEREVREERVHIGRRGVKTEKKEIGSRIAKRIKGIIKGEPIV